MTTEAQERIIAHWRDYPEVDRIDVIPFERGNKPTTVMCHMFSEISRHGPNTIVLEIIGVGTIKPDGEWELHGPTPIEELTIRPIPEEG